MEIRGVLPPVPTPFRADGTFHAEALRANLKRWNSTGLAGYLVLGSNGEAPHLSLDEKRAVLETAREAIPQEMVLMAGTGEATTRATISTTRTAASVGADCALVITPHFYRGQMTAEVLCEHYRAVADKSPIPILLYNVPPFTGVNLPADAVSALSGHENIVGIKDSLGELAQLGRIIRDTPEEFVVLAGSAPVFYPALCLGAHGGVLAVACALPKRCVAIHEAFGSGDHETARRGQLELLHVARLLTAGYGIGGLKAALEHAGYYGGPPRSPLPVPGPEGLQAIKEALDAVEALGPVATPGKKP